MLKTLPRLFSTTACKHKQVRKINTSFCANFWKKLFGKYLVWTNIVTSGVLMGLGDLIQQEIEVRREILMHRYDYRRITRMFLVGLSMGPLHHFFYKYMDTYLPERNLRDTAKKILLDQLIMSPLSITHFFYGMGLMEGKKLGACTAEINEKFMEVYLLDWCLWPPAQFVNFYYLPMQYHVLYINIVTMLYFVYLSYVKHRKVPE